MSNNNPKTSSVLSNPGVLILVGCCVSSVLGSIPQMMGCPSTVEEKKDRSSTCTIVQNISGIICCLVCWFVILKLFQVI